MYHPSIDHYAIIVAGGKGLRMGGALPKQFMPIGGRPVLMHTIDCLRRAIAWRQIVLVLPAEQHDFWRELCREHGFDDSCTLATGGQTRFHSVANGLAMLPAEARGIVAVHDGVRPFASPATIGKCCQAAETMGAAVPVTPVVETLRHIKQGTVPRQDYRLVQTPQAFRLDILRRAYAQPYQDAFTDDASVVETMGISVALTEGNRENIKLTTPFDMTVAEALLAAGHDTPCA